MKIAVGSVVTWNGKFYGKVVGKSRDRYYKSSTVRFDDSMGGTIEISAEEYFIVAQKYAAVMKGDD